MRAILAMLKYPDWVDWKLRFEEFRHLAIAAGYTIVDEVIQTKPRPISSTLFGRGKIDEIKVRAENSDAEILIVWNTLKSIQKINLERYIGIPVIDRYELVLKIFELQAGDTLAKLQIELAYLEKLIPYFKLRERLIHGPKDKPFFKAGGEYGWVPKVSWLRRRRKKIKEEIEKLLRDKIVQIEKRKAMGFKIVTLVGYYNAGKTSLFNALTGENKPVSDMPFTTLSPKYSRLDNTKILLVDTIGFVSDLDPRIISSFKINLEDLKSADMLLWIIDISDSEHLIKARVDTTADILERLELLDKPLALVINKIDLLGKEDLELRWELIRETLAKWPIQYVFYAMVSAKTRAGLIDLQNKIMSYFQGDLLGRP